MHATPSMEAAQQPPASPQQRWTARAGRPPSAPPSGKQRPLSAASAATGGTEDSYVTAHSAQYGDSEDSPTSHRMLPADAVWLLTDAAAEPEPLRALPAPKSPRPTSQKEARRRGLFRSGRVLLPPCGSQPLERADNAQLWVVLSGRVDVATSGACVTLVAGASFLVLPRTSYTIVAGALESVLVYAELLSGPIGPEHDGYPSKVAARQMLADETLAATPGESGDERRAALSAKHTALLAADHRKYVSRLRQELDNAQNLGLLRSEARAQVQRHHDVEAAARDRMTLAEVDARESIRRAVLQDEDAQGRSELARERMLGTVVPWCTLGCNYCCALQHELHRQVTRMTAREVSVLDRSSHAASAALVMAENLERRWLAVSAWSAYQQQALHERERELMLREVEVRWLALLVEQERERLDVRHKAHLDYEATRFEEDAWQLRNQSLDIGRGLELLQLREEAFRRTQTDTLEDQEALTRARVAAEHEAMLAEQHRTEADARIVHVCQQYEKHVKVLQQHARELQEYKSSREKQDAEAERLRHEEEQARLQQELEELRKAKRKKGGTKFAVPQSVIDKEVCDKCDQKVTKKEYITHIEKACPERPVQCPLCGQATRARELEQHLEECPQRDVRCGGCGQHYKAQVMATHSPLCESIRSARARLPGFRPVLGLEIADGERGLRVAAIKLEGPLDGLGVQEDDVMVSFDGEPTPTKAHFVAAIKKKRPGDKITVAFVPSARAVGPWWEADAGETECPAEPLTVSCALQTTIPLEEYMALVSLVEEDDKLAGQRTERGAFEGEFGALAKGVRRRSAGGRPQRGSRTGSPTQTRSASPRPGSAKAQAKPSPKASRNSRR